MIRAFIFDLDYCLLETREIPLPVYQPAFDAIRQANHGRVSEEDLQRAFSDIWKHPIDDVAQRYGFSEEMREGAMRHFAQVRVETPLCGYDDVKILEELPGLRFLVTTGYRLLQESKVEAMGIQHLFERIYVDAIDDPARKGKEGVFGHILTEYTFLPEEVMVVGDNSRSEIAVGNRLGMVTVQTLRPGVEQGNNAHYVIHSLSEIPDLLSHDYATPSSSP